MAITLLAVAENGAQATTLVYTLTAGQSIPAGNTIHVGVSAQDLGADPTCADSVNGSYTRDALQTAALPVEGAIFRFSDNALLGEGDTITVTFGANTFVRTAIVAWSDDLDLASPLDQVATVSSGSSTTPSTGGQTLVNDDARWLGYVASTSDLSVDLNEDADFTGLGTSTVSRPGHLAYRDVSTSETNDYTPTLDNTADWIDMLVAYKMTASGAVGPGLTDSILLEKRRLVA